MANKKVLDYLVDEPRFRERKNKDRGIVNLLVEKYPELKSVRKETLIEAVREFSSLDRAWRQALERDASLRGSDYLEKETLTKRSRRKLGYPN